jgi:hypothetical protein
MNWLGKVAAFKLLSTIPGGRTCYRFAQENLTHSLNPTPARVGQKIDVGLLYWKWLSAGPSLDKLPPSNHVDFGSGWHPTIPLLFYSLGMDRQYLFDAQPLLSRKMVDETVKTFLKIVTDPAWPHRGMLRRLPEVNQSNDLSWIDYLKKMGMTYHAPSDGMFPNIVEKIDVVTSTQVLLHIGRPQLAHYFRQILKSLRVGGKFLATIHLNDLHAVAGNGISQYNHLKFSPEFWDNWINSSLLGYNRFKARDYREVLEESGFKIRHFDATGPTDNDLRELDQIPIHDFFKRYSRDELGTKHLFFIAEKQ